MLFHELVLLVLISRVLYLSRILNYLGLVTGTSRYVRCLVRMRGLIWEGSILVLVLVLPITLPQRLVVFNHTTVGYTETNKQSFLLFFFDSKRESVFFLSNLLS